MRSLLTRVSVPSRAFACAAAGDFLPGGHAVAAATEGTLQLLLASEGVQDGEGQIEVLCEQPLFATVRALTVVPRGSGSGGEADFAQQDWLALLTDSGFLSILRFDVTQARFVAVQQLHLPPEPPDDPFRRLAVHQQGSAIVVASLGGTLCLFVAAGAGRGDIPPAPAGSGGGGNATGTSSSSGAWAFSGPKVLRVDRHLWSVIFVEETGGGSGSGEGHPWRAQADSLAPAPGATASGQHHFTLAALHQHPRSGDFAAVEYAVLCESSHSSSGGGGSGGSSGGSASASDPTVRLQVTAFRLLARQLFSGYSGRYEDTTSRIETASERGWIAMGLPRALVQLPAMAAQPWVARLKGRRLVLREGGLELLSAASADDIIQQQQQKQQQQLKLPGPPGTAAAQSLERWWRRYDYTLLPPPPPLPPQQQSCLGLSLLAGQAAGESLPGSPADSPAGSWEAARVGGGSWEAEEGEEARGAEPMAMSQQPSWQAVAGDDEEGDVEMQAVKEEEGGGEARAGSAWRSNMDMAAAAAAAVAAAADVGAGGGSGASGSCASRWDGEADAEASISGRFIACWCWEVPQQQQGRGQQQQQQQQHAAPVLLCALEDGSLWRQPLTYLEARLAQLDQALTPLGAQQAQRDQGARQAQRDQGAQQAHRHQAELQPGLLRTELRLTLLPNPASPQERLGSPARCLASLPNGLLAYVTDAAGVQLLRLSGHPGSSGHAETGHQRYNPLLPAHLLAAQQQLGMGEAGSAGCCTLPAAGAVVDCTLADLEGGHSGGGQQQQMYAVCRAAGSGPAFDGASNGGSLCILYQNPKPEVVFELPGAAEGITGLWGLKQRSTEGHHSLALLSYVGGSRLLAAQGGIFRDVSDGYGLHAGSQTLAAGNLAPPPMQANASEGADGVPAAAAAAAAAEVSVVAPAAVQVTSHGVILFGTTAEPLSRQGSGLPQAGSGSSSIGGLEGSRGSGSLSYAWRPPAGSTIGAAAVADQGVLAFCTGATRQLFVLLPAPHSSNTPFSTGSSGSDGGQAAKQPQQQQDKCLPLPQLVQAACLPMQAEVSCASNLLLPEALQGPGLRRCGLFAVGTYASAVLLLQLSWDPLQPQQTSLSVLQQIDLTSSSIAGHLPGGAAAAAAAATPLSPRTFQREQRTPESLLLLPLSSSGPSGSGGGGRVSAAGAAAAAAELSASLLVGLRTGSLLQLRCNFPAGHEQHQRQEQEQYQQESGLQQHQQGQQPAGQPQELLALSLGHMPLVLLPLPPQAASPGAAAACAAPPVAAVLCDRVSLLHSPAGVGSSSGRVRCQQLGLPQVQAAAALLLESGGLAGSCYMPDVPGAVLDPSPEVLPMEPPAQQQQPQQQQLFLLCAAADGCLRMVSLEALQLASNRCWPLPQRLQPSRVVAHTASGSVVVAGSVPAALGERLRWAKEQGWEEAEGPAEVAAVQVIDPSSGELLTRFTAFMPGEIITSLTIWDPTEPPSQAALRAVAGDGEETAAVAAAKMPPAWGREWEASGGGGDALRSHPIAFSPESPAFAAAAAAAAAAAVLSSFEDASSIDEARPWGGFIVIGTSIDNDSGSVGGEEAPGGGPKQWDDETSLALRGRLLLLQLATATAASASGSGRVAGAAAAGGDEATHAPWEQPPRRQLQLLPVTQLHLPSRVLALCPGGTHLTGRPGSSSSSSGGGGQIAAGGARSPRLFASVGRRLVAYEWRQRQQLLRRVTWIPTNRPLVSLQVTGGLLAAADRGEGATLYRYLEASPGSPQEREQRRASMARRFRMAPPGAAELRQRLGQMRGHLHDVLAPHGHGGQEMGGHLPGDEEAQLGFSAAAADCACRPAVGTVALPAEAEARAAGRGSGAGMSSSQRTGSIGGPAALTAATLDGGGQLRLLRQCWPRHEPTLHQHSSFLLGEPSVALLLGSLSYQDDGTGSSSLGLASIMSGEAGATATAGTAAGEMVAVTVTGSVLSLLPLDAQQAQQLSLLQRALTQHPSAAPLSGGSYANYRGLGSTGKGGSGEPPLVPFVHPPPVNIDAAAAAEAQPPASPGGDVQQGQQGQQAQQAGGLGPEPGAEQLAGPVVGPQVRLAADMQPGVAAAAVATLAPAPAAGAAGTAAAAAAGAAGPSSTSPSCSPKLAQQAQQAQQAAAAGVESVLDAQLLQLYLLMSPAEQQDLLAGAGVGGWAGGVTASLAALACQLSNLVAQLLL